jgi:hypothetical protein
MRQMGSSGTEENEPLTDCQESGKTPVLTVIASAHGPIVKRFSWDNENIHVEPAAQISSGHARTVLVEGPEELAQLIDNLGPCEALSLGRLPQVGLTYPLTAQHLRREGDIARTKEFFRWNDGCAWMLLDIDTKGLPEQLLDKLDGRDLADEIKRVVPELAASPSFVRASSSAGIILPNGDLRPANGLHFYVLVEKGEFIPRLLRMVHDRLWAAGLGYYVLSKAGGLLERSLVDVSVGSPERLIFEAAPIVELPLKRRPPPPRLFSTGEPLADVAAPDMDLVQRLKDEARELIRPTARVQKKRHETDQIDRVSRTLGISKTEARGIVKQRLEAQVLNDDDLLETGRGRFERVGAFLDRTTAATALPCPIEGSSYGTSTAYFYPPDDYSPLPRIISFAHGKITRFQFARFHRLKGLCWVDA